jgi:pyrroline-5-carboxylate reductase
VTEAKRDLRDFTGRLVIVGAGKMGGALLEGWLRFGLDPKTVAVFEPQPAPQISALGRRGLQINPGIDSLTNVEAIVVAVKPQAATEALPALTSMVGTATVMVSIMAGRTIRSIASALNRPCALVRAMPNTPAAIGRGITVAVAHGANDSQRDLAHRLLSAAGAVEWIEDDGRSHGRFGLRAGLRLPACRSIGTGWCRCGITSWSCREAGAGDGLRFR